MAWNEQYARILEQMKKNSVASATNNAITGAETKNDEPDCLFYTNFSRETAIAFYEIFDGFNGYFKSNPSFAVNTLKTNLKKQIDGMGNICPIEVMLYASRVIRDQLTNRAIKNALISLIQQYIPDNLKSVQYILSGWEWPQILSIVIEACGNTNDDATIKLAMDYCGKISKKFVDKNDNELLKSYITMIEKTQNEAYISYLTTIATLPEFEDDNVLAEYLVKQLRQDSFLSQYREEIATEIHAKTNNYSLKRSLERIMDNSRPAAMNNAFNMTGLNYERKVKQVEALDFTVRTSSMLTDFERSRENDDEIVLLTCKKILRDLSDMRNSDKNLALILVGTKGSRIDATELVEDITRIKNTYPTVQVAASISLAEIDPRNYHLEDAMSLMIDDPEIDDWYWAIGKYFRFRKTNFEKSLMRAFSERIADTTASDLAAVLARFAKLIETFNGNNDLLSTQQATQTEILSIVKEIINTNLTESACSQIVDILHLMLNYSKDIVLELLDELKKVSEENSYERIRVRVNSVIKKGDLAREPD